MSKSIYVSGKISGLRFCDYEQRFRNACLNLECEIENDFRKYDVVINPVKIKPFLGIKTWFFYMITDLFYLIFFCNHIYMLNNWKESRGAKIEHKVAKFLKYTIIYE